MVLLLDNSDSFTWNLYDYILQCGADCLLRREDDFTFNIFEDYQITGVVISPGPGKPAEHYVMQKIIKDYHTKIPMLGVCLGFQAMAEFFGEELIKSSEPTHGKTSAIKHNGKELFNNIPDGIEVMRYHSLMVKQTNKSDWQMTAFANDGIPMAGRHKSLPLYGVQFHPESILTMHGKKMIQNWLGTIH